MKNFFKSSAISAHTFKCPMMSANADVVTSVKPLGFIVSSIADGVTEYTSHLFLQAHSPA